MPRSMDCLRLTAALLSVHASFCFQTGPPTHHSSMQKRAGIGTSFSFLSDLNSMVSLIQKPDRFDRGGSEDGRILRVQKKERQDRKRSTGSKAFLTGNCLLFQSMNRNGLGIVGQRLRIYPETEGGEGEVEDQGENFLGSAR